MCFLPNNSMSSPSFLYKDKNESLKTMVSYEYSSSKKAPVSPGHTPMPQIDNAVSV